MKKFLPGILLFISCYSYAQVQLKPSNNIADSKWIKNIVVTGKMYLLHDTARDEIGTVKVTVEVKKAEDKIYIITEGSMKQEPSKVRMDTSIIHYADMSPVYFASYNSAYDMVLHFEKGNVTGYTKPAGKDAVVVNEKIQGEFFDPNSYPTILSWSTALKEGFAADFPVYNFYELKVVKAHLLKTESAKVDNTNVWKLTVEDENFPGIRTSYYFDKETRKHLRVELEMDGTKMLIIMD